jgi:hypothetical protein
VAYRFARRGWWRLLRDGEHDLLTHGDLSPRLNRLREYFPGSCFSETLRMTFHISPKSLSLSLALESFSSTRSGTLTFDSSEMVEDSVVEASVMDSVSSERVRVSASRRRRR